MNGKINIVFGFLYLASTAVLGPAVIVPGKGENMAALMETNKVVAEVKQDVEGGASGEEVSKKLAPAVVGIMDHIEREGRLAFVSSAAHAHGNLEALLNIVVGVVLSMLSIQMMYKSLLGAFFIVGAVFHSGMLYLAAVFGQHWATNFTMIGAVALIAGLILMAIASFVGLRAKA